MLNAGKPLIGSTAVLLLFACACGNRPAPVSSGLRPEQIGRASWGGRV